MSADVSMLVHGCGVSPFLRFYDKNKKTYQLLPGPYARSYLGEKGHKYLQETWVLELAKPADFFVLVSISDMPNIKYWKNLGKIWILQKRIFLNNAELVIHVFTSLEIIGGNLFTRHPKILIVYTKTVMIFCR